MSVTPFPHGILATPNLGASRLVDMWNKGNIFFVDGENGSADHNGKTPDTAVSHPSEAVSMASQWASIYIRPQQYTTYATIANYYYTDNITVPIGKAGISFIGAGPGGSHYQTVEIKTAAAASHVFDIYAPGVQIENMRLTGTSQTAGDRSVIRAMGDGSTNKANGGLGIRNCTFSNAKIGGAIRIDNPWNCTVDNCVFHNCAFGTYTTSSVSSTNGMWIKNCQFEGQDANIDCHIYASGGSANCYGLLVDNCTFNTTTPALSTGVHKRYIKVADTWTTAGGGMISDCHFAIGSDDSGDVGAAGTLILVPTTILVVGCYFSASAAAKTFAVTA